jgi:hypothetical protein
MRTYQSKNGVDVGGQHYPSINGTVTVPDHVDLSIYGMTEVATKEVEENEQDTNRPNKR